MSYQTAGGEVPVLDVHSHATLRMANGLDAGIDLPFEVIPPWSVQGTLDLQEQTGIDTCILSMPESGTHEDDAGNRARARRVNEFLCETRATDPARFGAMVALPLTSMDDALEELRYGLDELGMDAVSLPTSVRGVYLGDERFDPLMAELDARGATVFVHPVMPEAARPLSLGIQQSMLEFPFDTTRMITNMIFSRSTERFSRMKMIASHGGGTFPYLVSRLMTLEPLTGAGPGRSKLTPEEILAGARWFHYDLTCATSPAHLAALTHLVAPSQLLTGFDIPFMPPPTFRPAMDAIAAWHTFEAADVEAVLHGNAARLFPDVEHRRLAGAQR